VARAPSESRVGVAALTGPAAMATRGRVAMAEMSARKCMLIGNLVLMIGLCGNLLSR
jgi:hypothetical protein